MRWTRSFQRGVSAATAALCLIHPPPATADGVDLLEAAHTDRAAYEVRFRIPIQPPDAEAIKFLQSRPGWWNVVDWYDDPVSAQHMPIGVAGRLVVGADRAVRRELQPRMGDPLIQRGTIELVGRDFYVPPFPVDAHEAKLTRYPELSLDELARVRGLGRMPHADVWAPVTYSTMVSHLVRLLRSAKDVQSSVDGPITVLASKSAGVSAWIEADGALRSARLQLTVGEVQRFDFIGVSAAGFFPARFPAEMRVIQESDISSEGQSPKLVQIVLYDPPKRLSAEPLESIDPAMLGVPIVDLTPKDARVPGRLRAFTRSSWRVLSGVFASLVVIAVAAVVLKKRRHSAGSAS